MLATLALLALQSSADVRVEGWVQKSGGLPVAQARVVLAELVHARLVYRSVDEIESRVPGVRPEEAARFSREALTDERGAFAISGLAPGEYTLLVAHAHDGLAFQTLRVAESTGARPRVTLQSPTYVELTLPVSTAAISPRITPRTPRLNLSLQPSFAPSSAPGALPGTWRTTEMPAAIEWDVWLDRWPQPGDSTPPHVLAREPLDAQPGEVTRLTLDLGAGPDLSGRVLDPSGNPAAGVLVRGRCNSRPPRERAGITDGEGRFRLRNLRSGTWKLVAGTRMDGLPIDACGTAPPTSLALHTALVTSGDTEGYELRLVPLETALPGKPAPEPGLFALDGAKIELAALRGRCVALLLWQAHCDEALALLPALEALRAERGDELTVLAIELGGDAALVRRIAAGLPWTHAVAADGELSDVALRYGPRPLPHLALVAPDGTLDSAGLELPGLRARLDALRAGR